MTGPDVTPPLPLYDACMGTTAMNAVDPKQHRAKRSVALFSVFASLAITVLKILTGIFTGSLGMLSEAAHSGIDLIAASITLFSVQVSDRPADEDHNYGHGKVESLSAFAETVLMTASCIWIGYEAIHRILFHNRLALTFSIWPFAVLLLSVAVDYSRSRTLHRVASEQKSEALAADALHFGTDIWSSLAVMIGLGATYAGERWHLPRLQLADPIAALAVAAIILRVTWRLARRTVDTLVDATPPELRAERRNLVHDLSAIDGVLSIDRIRLRRSGSHCFADLTLGMDRSLTFQRSEQITAQATAAVQRLLPDADVIVHSVPIADATESIFDRVRAVAARLNLATHDVSVQRYDGSLHVEQHLEVDETMPLRRAHDLVTRLEAEMRHEVPQIATILTHIESRPATIEHPAPLDGEQIERALRYAAKAFPEILDIHEVVVTRVHGNPTPGSGDERLQITCHCTMPDELPMSSVHAVITAFEGSFKLDHPEVSRVLIHPEPATDNRR